MSAQNRTALKALITNWAAVLDLETDHKPAEQHILDSVLLNRDVINTISASTAATAVNFTGFDTIIVNAAVSSELTISGIADGEVKYLIVNKLESIAIDFVDATAMDFSSYPDVLTLLVYKLISKGSAGVLAIPMHKSFDYSAIAAAILASLPGSWYEAACISPWTAISNRGARAGIWYRKNGDYLDLSISVYRTLTGMPSIALLPVGFRPNNSYALNPVGFLESNHGDIYIDTGGNIVFTNYTTYPTSISLTCSIPLT